MATQTQQRGYFDPQTNQVVPLSFSHTPTYDGDGTTIGVDGEYYLKSSVLGGAVISEYRENGQWILGYVYAGTQLVGKQQGGGVPSTISAPLWIDQFPITGEERHLIADGSLLFDEPIEDPLGAEIHTTDPFPPDGSEAPNGDAGPPLIPPGTDTWWPYPMAGNRVTCEVDGMLVDCEFARLFEQQGALAQCPSNDCGPGWDQTLNNGNGGFTFVYAFADGFVGRMPYDAIYNGNGYYSSRAQGEGRIDDELAGEGRIEKPNFFGFGARGLFFLGVNPQKDDAWEHLPGSNMTACLVMADIAEQEANTALYRGSNESSALTFFDAEFSRLYHGGPIRGYNDAARWRNGEGRAASMRYYASNGSGFKLQYRDTGTEDFPIGGLGAEQTHHFSFYLSLGINSRSTNSNFAIYTYGYSNDNGGDQRLSAAAYNYGLQLRNRPKKLAGIGKWIRRNICTREGHGLYYQTGGKN